MYNKKIKAYYFEMANQVGHDVEGIVFYFYTMNVLKKIIDLSHVIPAKAGNLTKPIKNFVSRLKI